MKISRFAATNPMESQGTPRPWVFLNMAMTADAKIASANRKTTQFGSPMDLEHLYELRATADAILCGARTVEQSRATLGNGGDKFRNIRLRGGLKEYPLRVVVSGSGSIDPEAELWQHRFSPIVLLTTERARPRLKRLMSVADDIWICGRNHLDFHQAMGRLRSEYGVQRLLSEGGGELNESLFRANLVDEIHLTLCPLILGGRQAPTLAEGTGFPSLSKASLFRLHARRKIGHELFLVYRARTADAVRTFPRPADRPRQAT